MANAATVRASSRSRTAAIAPDHRRPRGFEFTADVVHRFQVRAIAFLVVASTVLQSLYLWLGDLPGLHYASWFFYLDSEQTLPPLYATLILLIAAGLSFTVGAVSGPKTGRWGWRALAAVLALAGIDEYASIHEQAIEPLRSQLDIDAGPLYYAWVIPGGLAVVALAVGFSGFLRRLPADTRNRYLLAGVLFVIGALGLEVMAASYVTGTIDGIDPNVDPRAARATVPYLVLTTIEETLEMVGAAIFVTATVAHLENHCGRRLTLSLD